MEELVIIETRLGKLRGRARQTLISKKKYYSFLGIPFGKPPVGELRFKDPQPFGGWEGVRDALYDPPMCKQPVMVKLGPQISEGDEDSLYLCIYITEPPEKSRTKKPVMVCFHGGGFVWGSGNFKTQGFEYFMEEDVVIVSPNYRLGPFGFLSLENEDVPGNAGLKDQTLALQWVRDNIDSFGGDPGNVTIFGISAGGASVHYNMLSPLSKGLFHKAIIQSGYGQNLWAFQPSPKKITLKLAKKLSCTSEDPGEILKFLQSVPSDDIITAYSEIVKEKEYIMCCELVFSPGVEKVGNNRFLPDTPSNLLKKGEFSKVPTILGLCQNEGTLQQICTFSGKTLEELLSIVNDNPDYLVPKFLGLKPGSSEEKEAQKLIWDFYFKGKPLSKDNTYEYVNYHGDMQFNFGFAETRRHILAKSPFPTFSYLFTNHSKCMCEVFKKMSIMNVNGNLDALSFLRKEETCHGSDSLFFFPRMCAITAFDVTPEHEQTVLKHIKTWVKFALTGDPSSEETGVSWDRDSEANPCYMDIGSSWVMKYGVPFAKRTDFWEELCSKYRVD